MALSDHSLVAHYMLTGDILDLVDSYNGFNAQNMSFSYDSDIGGYVADFNSSYYGIDNALQNGFDTEYTISMWIKPNSLGGRQFILANEQHGTYYQTFAMALESDGRIWVNHRPANGGVNTSAYTDVSTPVSSGQWTHIAATWSGTEIKWYINGALSNTVSVTHVPWNSPATMWVGANATKADPQYLDGKMADLRFYYSEFTASDISELYAAGAGPLEDGLVAQYALDSDASDSVGSNDGTITGATPEPDGSGFIFDGVNDYIEVPNDSSLNSNVGTLSTWVKFDVDPLGASSTGSPYLHMSVVSKNSSVSSLNGWNLFIADSTPRFQIKNASSATTVASSGAALNDGQWHHIVVTFESGGTTRMFVDKIQVGESADTVAFNVGSDPLRMAINVDSFWDKFSGSIKDTRLWNREISSTEVEALYSLGSGDFDIVGSLIRLRLISI